MEWFVDVRVEVENKKNLSDEEYLDRLDSLYDSLSEYLGGTDFEPAIVGTEEGLETYVYLDAESLDEAAEFAARMFSETTRRAFGPEVRVEVSRAITSEERDRELDDEGGEDVSEQQWTRAASANPAFGFLDGSREDVYGPEDGELIPEDPEEMSEETLRRLETENALRVLARYREIEERSVPAEELHKDLGFSREHMSRLRSQGRLVGLRLPFRRSFCYPFWQFDPESGGSLEGLTELVRVAREEVGMGELALDAFMTSPRSGAGTPPYRVFREGERGRERVLELLRASHDIGT